MPHPSSPTTYICKVRKIAGALLIAGSAPAFGASAAWLPGDVKQLSYAIFSNGESIGALEYDFSAQAETFTARSVEHMRLKRFFMTGVLNQTTESLWRGKMIEEMSAATAVKSSLKDGNISLHVQKSADGALAATRDGKTNDLPLGAWPFTPWHREFIFHDAIFDLGGGLVAIRSTSAGFETLTVQGISLSCERLNLTLEQNGKSSKAVFWYDSSGILCGMKLPSLMGEIEYIRISVK